MNEFQDWKAHPITELVLSELSARINSLTEQLIYNATTMTHEEIAEKTGIIKGYLDVVKIQVGDINDGH